MTFKYRFLLLFHEFLFKFLFNILQLIIYQEYISLTFCFKKQVKLKPAVTGSPGQRDSILESVPENVSC